MAQNGICPKSGLSILKASIDTPIGLLKLTSCQIGLHSIELEDQLTKSGENFVDLKPDSDNFEALEEITMHLNKAIAWIYQYFQIPKKLSPNFLQKEEKFEFCFPNSTEFEQEVLMTLFEGTKIGEKITYQQLAGKVNRPNASRAVGTAMKKNPIPLLIPCHRVIKSNGLIGNYNMGGIKMKEFLLNHEKERISQ